ncbi:MAG: DKNYY domain-containing protein [Nonlabens sp.]
MKKGLTLLLFLVLFISCEKKYVIKNNSVYVKGWNEGQGNYERLLENADAQNFSEIENNDNLYGTDKINVYYEDKIIPGADPKSFKTIKKGFAIDSKRAYYNNDSIENSSPRGFEVIDYKFSKNHNNIFYKTKPLNVCSVNDFRFVSTKKDNVLGRWSKDGCFYYFNNYRVPSNDYKDIVIFINSVGISRDNNHVYAFDKNYFDTNTRVVFVKATGSMVKDTIDIETFKIENNIMMDKFGRIN